MKTSEIAQAPVGQDTALNAAAAETQPDDGELVAVITAAIAAYTGTGNFRIKSISAPAAPERPKAVSNWVLCGRMDAFQSRRVLRK